MLSPYMYLSIILYLSWRVWVLSSRYYRLGSTVNLALAIDMAYLALMMFYLATSSPTFILLAIINFGLHVAFGLYLEIFRPDLKPTSGVAADIFKNYWVFLGVETAITILSYLLVAGL